MSKKQFGNVHYLISLDEWAGEGTAGKSGAVNEERLAYVRYCSTNDKQLTSDDIRRGL